MTDPISKTEQLIYQTSYRKHKERLADIKHNTTNFTILPRQRPEKRLKDKFKKEEMMDEQGATQKKKILFKVHNSHNHLQAAQMPSLREEPKHPRYEGTDNSKLEIKSDFSDGQPVRCIVPVERNRVFSNFNHPTKPLVGNYFSTKSHSIAFKKSRPQSFYRTQNTQRAPSQQKSLQKQINFDLLQRNEQRQVLHKKTIILSSTESCLIEVSMIDKRILIAAHIMGIESYCIKELLTVKRTKQLRKEYQNNYEELIGKISLEEVNKKYQWIKIASKQQKPVSNEIIQREGQSKNKGKVQKQFLQRNYYTYLKMEENQQEDKSNKSTIPQNKLDQLVERLAVPKKYLVRDHNPTPKQQPPLQSKLNIHIENKQYQPPAQSKISIHLGNKQLSELREKKKVSIQSTTVQQKPRSQHRDRQTGKRPTIQSLHIPITDSVIIKKSTQNSIEESKKVAPSVETSAIIHKIESNGEEVEYLDGQQNGQYEEEQFESPSGVSQHHKQQNGINNKSSNSKQKQKTPLHIDSKKKTPQKQKKKAKLIPQNQHGDYQNIYQNQFQNEKYQQQFQQLPAPIPKKQKSRKLKQRNEDSRKGESRKKKQRKAKELGQPTNQKSPVNKLEQEYPDEFQN